MKIKEHNFTADFTVEFTPVLLPHCCCTLLLYVVAVVAHALLVALLRTPFRRACPPGGYPYMPHVSHGLPADLSPGSSLMPHNNVNNMSPGAGGSYTRPAMVSHPHQIGRAHV